MQMKEFTYNAESPAPFPFWPGVSNSVVYRDQAGNVSNDVGLVGNWKACIADEEPGRLV